MEYRPLALGAGLVILLALVPMRPASGDDARLAAKRERAERLETDAAALRKEAARKFGEEEAACRASFFVNDCLKAAKDRRLKQIDAARRMEAEQATLEREIRYEELGERRAKKARQRAEQGPPPTIVVPGDASPLEARPARQPE